MFEKLRAFAKTLKREIAVLASAISDERTPWIAKLFGAAVIAYALSPIDLIPDFIPVIGFLDELILLPVCLWLLKRMIPVNVLDEHRARVGTDGRLPASRTAAIVIVLLWLIALAAVSHWMWDWYSHGAGGT